MNFAIFAHISETIRATTLKFGMDVPQGRPVMHPSCGLKASLKTRCDNDGDKWHHQLPWILLGLRATHKEDLDASPAELTLGDTLAIPGELLPTTTPDSDSKTLIRTIRYRNKYSAEFLDFLN